VLRAPELDAGLPEGSQQSGAEGQNPLRPPAAHAALGAAQSRVALLGCQHTLPGHAELLINQHPQVLLLRAALNPFCTQPVFVLGLASTDVQEFALGLVELDEVHTPLQPVKVPVDGIPSLQRVDHLTQLGVIGKLGEGALNPAISDRDVKQRWSQCQPLRNTTCL